MTAVQDIISRSGGAVDLDTFKEYEQTLNADGWSRYATPKNHRLNNEESAWWGVYDANGHKTKNRAARFTKGLNAIVFEVTP